MPKRPKTKHRRESDLKANVERVLKTLRTIRECEDHLLDELEALSARIPSHPRSEPP